MKDYGAAVSHSNSGDADKIYSQIHSDLFDQSGSADSDPCLKPLLEEYAIDATRINRTAFAGSVRGSFNEKDVFESDWLPNLTRKLLDAGKLKMLTPALRKTLGGEWNTRESNGENAAIGAYDCMSSTIYVDAELRPLDLASTLYHEMDHLFRDKYASYPAGTRFTQNGKMRWDLYNMAEEASALFTSAAVQIHLQSFDRTHVFGLMKNPTFKVANDLTFFPDGGPMMKISRGVQKGCGTNAVGVTPDKLACFNFLFEGYMVDVNYGSGIYGVDKNTREKILSTIWKAYFPTENPPDNLNALYSYDQLLNAWPSLSMLMWDFNSPGDVLDGIVKGLDHPSDLCKQYSQAVSSGAVDQYLGIHFEGSADASPVRGSIRPCLNFKGSL